jgi:hypothetical protein
VNGVTIALPTPAPVLPKLSLLSPQASSQTVVTTNLQVRVDDIQGYTNAQIKYQQPGSLSSGSLFPIPASSIVSFPVTLNLTTANRIILNVMSAQGNVLSTLDTYITLNPTITTTKPITTSPSEQIITTTCTSTSTSTSGNMNTGTCTGMNAGILVGSIIGGMMVGAVLATLMTYHIMMKRVSNKMSPAPSQVILPHPCVELSSI